jgi:hypothetical protein
MEPARGRRGRLPDARAPACGERASRGYSALRSSSLMEVFARVCASTRLTMTAQ